MRNLQFLKRPDVSSGERDWVPLLLSIYLCYTHISFVLFPKEIAPGQPREFHLTADLAQIIKVE
jgi:hypothetical protein